MAPFYHTEPKPTAAGRNSDGSINAPTMNEAENGGVQTYGQYPNDPVGGYKSGAGMSRHLTPGGHQIDTSQPAFPVYHRRFANPAPLGLLAFGATTFILSMYNVRAGGVATPNVVLGMAMGYGGLVQLIAGIQEWACGNTFGATAFASYGGFWFSFGTLYIPQFQVVSSYTDPSQLRNALGIYLAAWAVVTLIFFLATFKSSVALSSLFFFLIVTFVLLSAGEFTAILNVTRAGGAFGIFTAAIAGYTALAGLLTKDSAYFKLPVGDLSRKD